MLRVPHTYTYVQVHIDCIQLNQISIILHDKKHLFSPFSSRTGKKTSQENNKYEFTKVSFIGAADSI